MLYDGGFLAAEALDRWVIEHTGQRYGLIDILRTIYRKNPGGALIDEQYLISSVNVVADQDSSPFIRELIHTPATGILAGGRAGGAKREKISDPAV